ncbi:putative lipoprotein [Nocardioidaceae bacterium Broad-1]|nr:putative lipoprotein [Nocardioidaceae bacterium Broad-1]
MRNEIKVAVAGLTLLSATACGGGDGGDANADDPVDIDVTVSNATEPYVIPWLVAKEQGFFADRGVNVNEIIPSKGGSTTVRNMLSGDLPIADVGFSSVLESVDAGAPVTVVGGATQSTYVLDFYTMADNKDIQTIDDIKVWAYTNPESVTQAMTYILPEVAGVDGADVKRVASGGAGEGIALLEAGDVDAAVVVPSVLAKEPGKFREVVSSAEYLDAFQQSVITTTPEYAEENPGVVEAVVAGYQEAVDWITANPEDAGAIYAEYSDIDTNVATDIVKKALSLDNWGAGFNPDAIDQAYKAAQTAGFDGDVDLCDVFDADFLPDGASTDLPVDCE